MASFTITIRDSCGQIVESLEAAMRNAGDWSKFWEDRNGRISKLWAKSRQDMFATEGASTGPAWPKYTRQEQRYWLPIKRWSLGVKTIQTGGILRWTKSPRNAAAAPHERLYPSLCSITHPQYIYQVNGTRTTLGTAVPYAANHNLGRGVYTRRTSRKKSGTVSIPTPCRPLVRFGDAFLDGVRDELKLTAAASGAKGKKIGITDADLATRFALSRGI